MARGGWGEDALFLEHRSQLWCPQLADAAVPRFDGQELLGGSVHQPAVTGRNQRHPTGPAHVLVHPAFPSLVLENRVRA
ncbi:hypothetical protein D0T12_19890 [Actinomadura spongiicola]|uniref:Uncharacterized protein n=1 Tax=Actinomadura spongiicola TaxID=2303421 RepID=A0A372GD64_9ACTN|nr:hypothetical protein D0T12_19890 [Actinomadura spongiicola]